MLRKSLKRVMTFGIRLAKSRVNAALLKIEAMLGKRPKRNIAAARKPPSFGADLLSPHLSAFVQPQSTCNISGGFLITAAAYMMIQRFIRIIREL